MKRVLTSLVLMFSLTSVSLGQQVVIKNGLGTPQMFLELPKTAQGMYAMGAVNGMLLAPVFGAEKAKMQWFEECIEGMNAVQVAAIIEKYVREHPERWHETAPFFIYNALHSACPKIGD